MAGSLLELSRKVKSGKGYAAAKEILQSGKALKKMKEIIKAQGEKCFSSSDLHELKLCANIPSKESGRVDKINVRSCSTIARIAGAPGDKKAGLYLFVSEGDIIKQKQPLFRIFSENRRKLKLAVEYAKKARVVETERSVLERIP